MVYKRLKAVFSPSPFRGKRETRAVKRGGKSGTGQPGSGQEVPEAAQAEAGTVPLLPRSAGLPGGRGRAASRRAHDRGLPDPQVCPGTDKRLGGLPGGFEGRTRDGAVAQVSAMRGVAAQGRRRVSLLRNGVVSSNGRRPYDRRPHGAPALRCAGASPGRCRTLRRSRSSGHSPCSTGGVGSPRDAGSARGKDLSRVRDGAGSRRPFLRQLRPPGSGGGAPGGRGTRRRGGPSGGGVTPRRGATPGGRGSSRRELPRVRDRHRRRGGQVLPPMRYPGQAVGRGGKRGGIPSLNAGRSRLSPVEAG